MSRYIVGITGTSGVAYGVRLVELLARGGAQVDLTITAAGLTVLAEETDLDVVAGRAVLASLWPDRTVLDRLRCHPVDCLNSPLAGGSDPPDGMVVCPCSMNTLGALAGGLADNLLRRAAMVTLKERRPLVIVPRETPLTDIILENMLRLSRSGAIILPAMPGFYRRPQSVAEMVDFIVARVLNLLGVEHDLPIRWSPRQ